MNGEYEFPRSKEITTYETNFFREVDPKKWQPKALFIGPFLPITSNGDGNLPFKMDESRGSSIVDYSQNIMSIQSRYSKMKSLDRTLIEKAGYDNGFEIAKDKTAACYDSSIVSLYSSIHAVKVDITCGKHDGSYVLEFSDNLNLAELKRGLNKEFFLNDKIEVWNRELLGIVLKRAAELGVSLPDGPIRLYHEHLDAYLLKNPEESSFFKETSKSMFKGTEREQLVKQRIGQDVFREALFKYWKGSCAITTLDIPEMLRASHIRPWAKCDNDNDRLNVYNGFLLSANFDALFDKGLITFDDKGQVIFSAKLSKGQIQAIEGDKFNTLRWIDERHLPFLEWHRNRFFHN